MTSSELIPEAVLNRKAVVYVRQSTQSQVMTNLESQRRQYDLVEVARQRGFVDVEIIDDDLGRSASGTVRGPGSTALSHRSALAKSVQSYASTRRGRD
jgi:DNA invertase Pin-like site-specific DNA recombinase